MIERSSSLLSSVLAQVPRPIDLAGRSRTSILELYPYALPVAGVAACVGVLGYFGVRAALDRAASQTSTDRRLSKLARHMGLTRADMELLKRLALAHGKAEPGALLLSRHAFREAAARFAEGIITPADRERLVAIAAAVGVSVDEALSTGRVTPRDRQGRSASLSIARRQGSNPGQSRLSA